MEGGGVTRCDYCTRKSVTDFPDVGLHFCEPCGRAFREGFEKGKVYESVRRRKTGRVKE